MNDTTTIRYIVNQEPFRPLDMIGGRFDFGNIVSFKNLQYEEVIEEVPAFCRLILDRMMGYITSLREYQYVFIQLLNGPQTQGGLWHLDSSLNPTADYENFLFIADDNPTEFAMNPMTVAHASTAIDFHKQIVAQRPHVQAIPPYTICRYNGSNVHRRPPLTHQGKRLLIRLSNTDAHHTRYGFNI